MVVTSDNILRSTLQINWMKVKQLPEDPSRPCIFVAGVDIVVCSESVSSPEDSKREKDKQKNGS